MIDLLIIFPELFLLNAAISLLVYGVTFQVEKKTILSSIGILSLCSLFLTGLLLVNQPVNFSNFFFYSCIIDNFTFFFKITIIVSSFIVLLMSRKYIKETRVYAFENLILVLLAVSTMMILVSAYDLLPLYLAIELQSLCFYVLAASKRNSEFSTEAGLKYFLLGAFSSGILLFGFSLIYGFTGMTNFEDLAKLSYTQIFLDSQMPLSMTIGIIFIAVGFLFKMTAVPFHMWAPDVYEGSPTYITAFFAIVPKIAILGVFLRLFDLSLHGFFDQWETVFVLSSLASMLLGSVAAMAQQKLKRLLAYSSIGHVGLMFIGFCCGTIEGVQALLIYIVVYMIMSCGLFALALCLQKNDNEDSETQFVQSISQLASLGKTNPILAFTFTIIMFSMAGIPPLAGFCSKFYLFFAALSSSLYLLAFIGVLTSVISCFYYIRFVKIMYFQTETMSLKQKSFSTISFESSAVLAMVGIFLVFFFIYPSPLFLWTHKTAIALCF
uniref:NADH dehydrogenase subunit 2 n=1 Tax=Tetraselmis marina TaxID=41888 RepID=UPI0021821576|nr:NADH dehydrogenase subunit 2 [Tetraselmis marina]UVF37902.1 NADH dehydrogenase subunit 2 [Tetraselmis marina]